MAELVRVAEQHVYLGAGHCGLLGGNVFHVEREHVASLGLNAHGTHECGVEAVWVERTRGEVADKPVVLRVIRAAGAEGAHVGAGAGGTQHVNGARNDGEREVARAHELGEEDVR